VTIIASPDQRVAAAIAIAITLARKEPSQVPAYRVDGVPGDGAPSAWRALVGPGATRLGARGGRW